MPLPDLLEWETPLFPRMGALAGLSRDTGSYVRSSDLGSSTSRTDGVRVQRLGRGDPPKQPRLQPKPLTDTSQALARPLPRLYVSSEGISASQGSP